MALTSTTRRSTTITTMRMRLRMTKHLKTTRSKEADSSSNLQKAKQTKILHSCTELFNKVFKIVRNPTPRTKREEWRTRPLMASWTTPSRSPKPMQR